MLKVTLLLVLLVCFVRGGPLPRMKRAKGFSGKGSDPQLKFKLTMRCTEFRAMIHEKKLMSDKDRASIPQCKEIVDAFLAAFANKGPCDVEPDAFSKVIKMTMKSLGPGKITLWSGVQTYMKDFAKEAGLYALETGTFLGYMGDSLDFCGQRGSGGINYDVCPAWGECRDHPEARGSDVVGTFWKSISNAFAETAEGRVRILMLGTGTRDAYRESSVLGSTELPTIFRLRRVTSLEPLLAHEPGKEVRETCANGRSMKVMEALIRRHDIGYKCIDDPAPLVRVLCRRFPKECEKGGIKPKFPWEERAEERAREREMGAKEAKKWEMEMKKHGKFEEVRPGQLHENMAWGKQGYAIGPDGMRGY